MTMTAAHAITTEASMREPHAYIRRSATGQSSGDVSREFQTSEVAKLAGDDADHLVVIDRDWGKSASRHKRSKREGLDELLLAIEAGDVSTLYAYAADRLSRDTETAMHLLNACERAKVPIVTKEGTFTPGDRSARLLFTVQAATNEDYSSQASEKRHASVAVTRKRIEEHESTCPSDKVCGKPRLHRMGVLPFGAFDGEDVDAVIDAFMEAGSYQGAARLLIKRGVMSRKPNKHTGGPAWESTQVRRVILRERPDLAPPTKQPRAKARTDHVFARLLLCPHDGSPLSAMIRLRMIAVRAM